MRVTLRRIALTLLLGLLAPWAVSAESDRRERTKEFLVMGYQGLITELSTQRGPYLNTLLDLLGTDSGQQAQMIGELKVAAKAYPNIMDFTDHVLERYLPKTAAPSPLPVPPPSSNLVPLPVNASVYTGESLENALMHLGKGMKVTVYLKNGERVSGTVNEYDARRLWIRTPKARSFKLDEIRGLEAEPLSF